MRIFQVGNIYPAHLKSLLPRLEQGVTFESAHQIILDDVAHAQLLGPCIEEQPLARLCFPQYTRGLHLWATERGMHHASTADEIVAAMIEEHRAEVFYSINATHHSEKFVRNLPGCVKLKIGWLGSRNVGGSLNFFDAIVSNFPTLNACHRAQGLDTFYLTPSYETQTDRFFATISERPIDIFFTGTYSRHHIKRARLIEAISNFASDRNCEVRLHLLNSRYSFLSERTPLGWFGPFREVRRPRVVRSIARPPLFGADMFKQLCSAKVVINMAIDAAGRDRGNMRCFEAVSAGAVMISDDGDYPEGFESGQTHLTYQSVDEAISIMESCLVDPSSFKELGQKGASMLRSQYSKFRQWNSFVELCDRLRT